MFCISVFYVEIIKHSLVFVLGIWAGIVQIAIDMSPILNAAKIKQSQFFVITNGTLILCRHCKNINNLPMRPLPSWKGCIRSNCT